MNNNLLLACACSTALSAMAASPELLMKLDFEGTARASFAKGAAEPLVAEGLEFAPGYTGQAVRFSSARKSKLVYAAKDNFAIDEGMISFRVKRGPSYRGGMIAAVDGGGRSLFAAPWDGRLGIRLTRDGKTNKHYILYGRDDVVRKTDGWERWVIAWNGEHMNVQSTDGEFRLRNDIGACRGSLRGGANFQSPISAARFIAERDSATHPKGWKDRRVAVPADVCALAERLFLGCDARGNVLDDVLLDDVCIYRGTKDPNEIAAELAAETDEAKYLAKAIAALPAKNPYELDAMDPADESFPYGKLELLRTIDLTDPAERTPDRFRSSGPLAVKTLDGARYLECGAEEDDRFAVRFSVDTKDPLYVLDFDYPDDARRSIDIVVQAAKAGWDDQDYNLSIGILAGGEYPSTGRMMTHRCLLWTKHPDSAVCVRTARKGQNAALGKIRIYRVPAGALPVARVADAPAAPDGARRLIGAWWEEPILAAAISRNQKTPQALAEQVCRYAAVLKNSGMNILAYPAAWYHGYMDADINYHLHAPGFLSVFYEQFDREGLFLMPTVQVLQLSLPEGFEITPAALTNGTLHASPIAIHDTGLPVKSFHNSPPDFNISHPYVQAELKRIFRRILEVGGRHKSFHGIELFLPEHTYAWWGGLAAGYNDYTIDAFTKKTGIAVPGDRTDPQRGQHYAAWLKEHAREAWIQWRCDVITDLYAELGRMIREFRPDLKLYLLVHTREPFREPDFMSGEVFPRLVRESGLDVAALVKRVPNVVFGTYVSPGRNRKRAGWFKGMPGVAERYFDMIGDPLYYRGFAAAPTLGVNSGEQYWENAAGNPMRNRRSGDALNCDWFTELAWRVSLLNPSGFNAMRAMALPLRERDMAFFTRGGYLIPNYGMERLYAPFAAAFRALPAVPFETLPSSDPDVVLRTATYAGKRYLAVLNASSAKKSARVPLLAGEKEIALDPYELKTFAETPSAR